MVKNNKQLKINEENYMGYVELYKTYYMSKKQDKLMKNTVNRLIMGGIISVATLALTENPVIFGILFSTLTFSNMGYCIFEEKKEENRLRKTIKENYPYVDLFIDKGKLENALRKEKILTDTFDEEILGYKLDVESYEQRLEEERFILKDRNNSKKTVENEIDTNKEIIIPKLEPSSEFVREKKVKVKVKKMLKK